MREYIERCEREAVRRADVARRLRAVGRYAEADDMQRGADRLRTCIADAQAEADLASFAARVEG